VSYHGLYTDAIHIVGYSPLMWTRTIVVPTATENIIQQHESISQIHMVVLHAKTKE
jgi:hypothetical protein